jgi:hypothetical protein
MKKILYYLTHSVPKYFRMSFYAIFLLFSVLFQGCLKDTCKDVQTFTQWNPVFKTDAEMNVNPIFEVTRALKNPGKIYFYDKYLLINEQKRGIHIIDNSNLTAPKNIGFIKIDGNIDMAIKGNMLYVDSYDDLLCIDITSITSPKLAKRNDAVFPSTFWRDPTRGWLVDYEPEKITREIDCNDPRLAGGGWERGWFSSADQIFTAGTKSAQSAFSSSPSASARPAGVGGSMARFTLVSEYLYTVDQSSLRTFTISKLDNPILSNTTVLGWGIETIFPYKDKLFLGSNSGMFIVDIVNPTLPKLLSNFSHARKCDPVFVDGDLAYVTLNGSGSCGGNGSQMDIIDISNLSQPKLLKTYPMTKPKGLSILDNMLYLCDDGLKIYDVTKWDNIDQNLKAHITGFDTYDVISFFENANNIKQRVAMVIGKDGFTQLDVTNPAAPKELSRISVSQ